jgi:hypothetical protein
MKPPLLALAGALTFVLVAPTATPAAVDQTEWDAAVAAAQQVDPTISPQANDPSTVNAVGGGHPTPGVFPNFGFGATIGSGGLNGQMTLVDATGQASSATVVCLAVAGLDGGGAIARLIGEVKPGSANARPIMVFEVTDSGLSGGNGDMWAGGFRDEAPPCTPAPGLQPIEGGIVINVP